MTDTPSASQPADRRRFHVTFLDQLVLRGRDPYRPVYLLRFERLRYALLAAVMVAVLGAGLIAWSAQQKAREVCLQRNAASVVYRNALTGLAEAAAERGDKRSSAIFRALIPQTPLPEC
jgi:hypothetical protein